jgi:hypothetical protein
MVKVNYVGVTNPRAAFNELRPLRDKLRAMQGKCRPFQADYLVLDAALKALDTAAYHFTREPEYFGLKPDQSKHGQPPDHSSRPGREGW